jgi:polysaccharide biosynthesis/export protein
MFLKSPELLPSVSLPPQPPNFEGRSDSFTVQSPPELGDLGGLIISKSKRRTSTVYKRKFRGIKRLFLESPLKKGGTKLLGRRNYPEKKGFREIKKSLKALLFNLLFSGLSALPAMALPLSPGDRLEVSIPNDTYFARVYEVNQDGNLEIPYLGLLPVGGLEPPEVQTKLSEALIEKKFFPPNRLQLSVQVLLWAPVQVSVAGAVFQPGRILINDPSDPPAITSFSTDSRQVTGSYPVRRYLTVAVRAAGGVLPTADLTQVKLVRNNQEQIVDLSGIFVGSPIVDIPLIAGDQVVVPPSDRFQPELMRPSQITPPGIKVFVSNLTVPATSNATSAVGNQQEGITFPYGARFSQAVISANCAGGIVATNADRKAILIRVDTLSGKTTVVERKVEDLLRNSTSNEDNPPLLPRDGVACYDSDMTNTRDIFRSISELLNPLNPLILLLNFLR